MRNSMYSSCLGGKFNEPSLPVRFKNGAPLSLPPCHSEGSTIALPVQFNYDSYLGLIYRLLALD